MDRRERILEHIRPGMRGIEIGPYFAPLVSKADGWDVLALDVFPTEELRRRAAEDPNLSEAQASRIEPVDLVGPAHRMADLAEAAGHAPGSFDFVVSSHNFEHLPDPVRFLQAAEAVLRPGGVLAMAVPDKRFCFDMLRPRTTLGAVLEAYLEKREQPTRRQVFELGTEFTFLPPASRLPRFGAGDPLRGVTMSETLEQHFAEWRASMDAAEVPYTDTHCWTFTPSSAALLLSDLRFLGLIGLEVLSCGPTFGIEFFVHLRRPAAAQPVAREAHYAERRRLFGAILAEERDQFRPQTGTDAMLRRVLRAVGKGR